jgi:hypothetical protein
MTDFFYPSPFLSKSFSIQVLFYPSRVQAKFCSSQVLFKPSFVQAKSGQRRDAQCSQNQKLKDSAKTASSGKLSQSPLC